MGKPEANRSIRVSRQEKLADMAKSFQMIVALNLFRIVEEVVL